MRCNFPALSVVAKWYLVPPTGSAPSEATLMLEG